MMLFRRRRTGGDFEIDEEDLDDEYWEAEDLGMY